MTPAALLLTAAALLAQATADAPTDALKNLESKEGRFTAKLPGEAKKAKVDVPTPIGPIAMHTFLVEKGKTNAYAVLYSDYPEAILKADPDKVLDGARDGAVRNVNGKLVKGENTKLGEVPGRSFEYEIDQPDGAKLVGRCRIYLDKARLYQVMVVAEPEVARSKTSTEVLDSLKLTK